MPVRKTSNGHLVVVEVGFELLQLLIFVYWGNVRRSRSGQGVAAGIVTRPVCKSGAVIMHVKDPNLKFWNGQIASPMQWRG